MLTPNIIQSLLNTCMNTSTPSFCSVSNGISLPNFMIISFSIHTNSNMPRPHIIQRVFSILNQWIQANLPFVVCQMELLLCTLWSFHFWFTILWCASLQEMCRKCFNTRCSVRNVCPKLFNTHSEMRAKCSKCAKCVQNISIFRYFNTQCNLPQHWKCV